MLAVVTAQQVSDVGVPNQIRAGRQLTAADFTNFGLPAPAGLWNLSDLTDASGNGRTLTNKGGVPFGVGINGLAATAAQFTAQSTQGLYIPDTGTSDPFRIKMGSWGCWFKGTPVNNSTILLSKYSAISLGWYLGIQSGATAVVIAGVSPSGSSWVAAAGQSIVVDDRWHFAVVTYDGARMLIYVDNVLEFSLWAAANTTGPMPGANAPLNIGSGSADSTTAPNLPSTSRIDEAFVAPYILSEDQIHNLYCAKISHTLAAAPAQFNVNVRRRRRGAALSVSDFPTQPLRLHNFSAGSLGDEGSQAVGLTNNGSGGGASSVNGPDGQVANAFHFASSLTQSLSSTDTGLPSGLATRSYGCWFKLHGAPSGANALVTWGAQTSTNNQGLWMDAVGTLKARSSSGSADDTSGAVVSDEVWHFAVVVEDNAAADGIKRKLYCDGVLVGTSLIMNSINAGGANRFRIGVWPDGSTGPMNGPIDGVFVCDYALTCEQILVLYAKSSQTLAPSPKNPGDHINTGDTNNLLATFDTLDANAQVDLKVA